MNSKRYDVLSGLLQKDIEKVSREERKSLIKILDNSLHQEYFVQHSQTTITVNYAQNIPTQVLNDITSGATQFSYKDVGLDHTKRVGKKEVKMCMTRFGTGVNAKEVLMLMTQMGLRPATLKELVAFKELDLYSKMVEKGPIVALGTMFRYKNKTVELKTPYLYVLSKSLSQINYLGNFDCNYRFLAIIK